MDLKRFVEGIEITLHYYDPHDGYRLGVERAAFYFYRPERP